MTTTRLTGSDFSQLLLITSARPSPGPRGSGVARTRRAHSPSLSPTVTTSATTRPTVTSSTCSPAALPMQLAPGPISHRPSPSGSTNRSAPAHLSPLSPLANPAAGAATSPDERAVRLWEDALKIIRPSVTRPLYDTCLSRTTGLSWAEGVFTIEVPNQAAGALIEDRLYTMVVGALQDLLESPLALAIESPITDQAD